MGEVLRHFSFGKRGSDGLEGQGGVVGRENLEKDPSTSSVARQSYAAALKTGHASRVQSVGGLPITPQDQLVKMHKSLKEMETQLVELKTAITFMSTKIDRLSARGNRVVRNMIGPNPLNLEKGKRKIGFGPVPITRSRRVWLVKRKSGLFEVGSTSSIGIETSVMECHSPHVTQDRLIVGITPLVPEETMAPSLELKEKGVLPRSKGDVGSAIIPEVKELVVTPESPMGTPIPLERTNGVTGEPIGLALVPCVEECLESGVQVDGDIVAPLLSLPPIADWILPKVNEIQ
ncbi:hypothetical protein F2P56_030394 [Juglans regia]|uniref:Uncharacterized protein n=1 Tax=Juglans regia TaxID=51240 RepID=A0A833WXL5_JUGRE|nr:hypothetical protein F2P56_030394 [Juglans regia]